MPALDLTAERPVNGGALDATQISNGFTEIQTTVNSLDESNWGAGQVFPPSKIQAGGAAVGDVMRWTGSLWAPAALSEAELPDDIPVGQLAPGVEGEVVKTVGGVVAWGTDVSGGGGGTDIPAASIFFTARSTAPSGYLICDGAAVSRVTYAALFSAISTQYGVGDGSTTFNLPNLKGRVVVPLDAAQTEFDTLGETAGAKTHPLVTAELPSHTHPDGTLSAASHNHGTGTLAVASHVHSLPTDAIRATSGSNQFTASAGADYKIAGAHNTGSATPGLTGTTGSQGADVTGATGSTGSGTAHNNLQPFIVLNAIIKT